MPIDLSILCRQIEPLQTVLLFGAGSSIPSGGMSGAQLGQRIAEHFNILYDSSLSLSEISTLAERRQNRRSLVHFIRSLIHPLRPTGSLLNLPYYQWKSIFTTNYDTLIEKSYQVRSKACTVFRSNFDFGISASSEGVNLYKLHGSIEEDICDGRNSRLILTVSDYDLTDQYREILFDTFRQQISYSTLLIIGYSLTDPDLKAEIDEALRRRRESGSSGRVFLLLYTRDENRAAIFEDRGISVCFGSLDDFFVEMSAKLPPTQLVLQISDDPLDVAPILRPSTFESTRNFLILIRKSTAGS